MVERFAREAMGTRVEIVLPASADARAIAEHALDAITEWHDRLSAFDRASALSHINRDAHQRPVRVEGDLFELLARCAALMGASEGAFNPCLGRAMHQLGFRDDAPNSQQEPWSVPGMALDAGTQTVRLTDAAELDLGACAKGWALDDAAHALREHDITSAFIHAGTSTSVAIGSRPDGAPWRVRTPAPTGPITADLADCALSISAPHGRVIGTDDGPRTHVLDPRTGRPAIGADTALVIGPSAFATDAWATALLVLRGAPATTPTDLTHAVATQSGWTIGGRDTDLLHTEPPQ